MSHPTACPEEVELCDLARGTLSQERGALLRDHIGDCQACRVAVAELTSAVAHVGGADARDGGYGDSTRYELQRLLATGGMGEVFLARDTVLGRDVAIKLLHERAFSPEARAESRQRILREAQALANFAHPNVVAVYDQGLLDGRPFLAMEYVKGRTLREWIAEEKPEPEAVIDMLVQAGEGLVAAHAIGFVHRDVKPENVLVGDDGRARITDFGLARSAPTAESPSASSPHEAPALPLAQGSAISGTPAYMAPEQLRGAPADARSDQYAFAITLFEAIHGKRPSLDSSRARVSADNKQRAGRIEAAITRALSTDPLNRFSSMKELLVEIQERDLRRTKTHGVSAAVVAAALLCLTVGAWFAVHHHATKAAASAAVAALHTVCTGVRGGCPSPLVCRYPEGNYCGAGGEPGMCAWPADGCNAKSTEVCGCDGRTYANQCATHLQGVSAAYHGACVPCSSASACLDVNAGGVRSPAFCRVDGARSSGAARTALAGVCWPRPSACEAAGPSVCGLDGRTYISACEARRSGFDIDHEGECAADSERATSQPDVSKKDLAGGLAFGAPDEEKMDARPLISLATWIEREKLPIYSLLVSKNGVIVFELYTSSVTRDDAHYLMGATAAITGALMGVAIDRHLVRGPEAAVADALPAEVFPSAEARERFRRASIRDLLGMSALDATVPPHDRSEAAQERGRQFLGSPDRLRVALDQPLVSAPGTSYAPTDMTPEIAAGIIQYATRMSALDFAEESLFRPMEFQNFEWMHQDKSGMDTGAYGLRLRPVDMQKFGVLYLREGMWGGKRVLSSDWALRSFMPWIKRSPSSAEPDFGCYWSTVDYGSATSHSARSPGDNRWRAHMAIGWKGQRIAVFVEPQVVVTMTGVVEFPEDDASIFRRIVRDYVAPAVDGTGAGPAHPDAQLRGPLSAVLERVQKEPPPFKAPPELRMVPTALPKEHHARFRPK